MTDQLPASRSNSAAFKQAIVGGYDRDEVDEYVATLERRIEELQQVRTPDGAVQRRLAEVGDEVAGILQRAHETADQLTEAARTEADQLLESARRESEELRSAAQRESEELRSAAQRESEELRSAAQRESEELRSAAQREAREMTESARREADERIGASHRDAAAIAANAQTRLRELDVDADRVWGERERILSDMRYLAQQLVEVVDAANERFPADEPVEEDDGLGQGGGLVESGGLVEDAGDLEGEGGQTHEAGEVTSVTDEMSAVPSEVELLPGDMGDPDGATQSFDVEELFAGEDPKAELPPGSKGDLGEGPELAGD